MRIHRPSAARGRTEIGWLDSRHSFSFGEYHDPSWMGFRSLRVINDDVVQAGQGFDTHPHRDMEIVTWVLAGLLEHRDSTGGGGILGPGGVQGMSAGTGIRHSEFNPSPDAPARFLQVWIQPARRGSVPRYGQAEIPLAERNGRWAVVAAGPERKAALTIGADAVMLTAVLAKGGRLSHPIASGRHAWLQIATGTVTVDGRRLEAGDGLAVSEDPGLEIVAESAVEVVLFDLA